MEIKESFFKGINRAISRDEFFDPDFFYTIQNARLLESGRIGEIVRIKGFEKITNELDDLDTLYDMIRICSCLLTNPIPYFVVYYKDISGNYVIKVFDQVGDLEQTFTYTSDVEPVVGSLQQHEDSIFIAPHNKVLYEAEGDFYFTDFISTVTKIDDISLDVINANSAIYDITVKETLDGIDGTPAEGFIKINRNNIPQGVTATFKVSIDGVESIERTIDGSRWKSLIAASIHYAIQNTPAYDGVWTSRLGADSVTIVSETTGSDKNDIEIDIVGSDYIRVENISDGYFIDAPTSNWIDNVQDHGDGITSARFNMDFVESSKTTFTVHNTRGGTDGDNLAGSLNVILKDAIATDIITIVDTDTVEDIAEKLELILKGSTPVTERYNVERITNPDPEISTQDTIRLTARAPGKKYNTDVVISINSFGNVVIELPVDFFEVNEVQKGSDNTITGTLEPYTHYWYTARLRYVDGHITNTCPPRLIESGPNGFISVLFDVDVEDLDGTRPRLQIFRKKETEGFFLIEEVDLDEKTITNGQFEYIDNGRSRIEPLVEAIPIWTKQHRTQEVIDNRLVKGNVEYFNEEYKVDPEDFTVGIEAITDDLERDVAPYNSRAQVYFRPQYKDGTLGFFTEIDNVEIPDESNEISVKQNFEITTPEKEISKLKFYGKYLPFGEEQNLDFNSIEIQTPNLGGIADPLQFPTQTKIFFGYKYISVVERGSVRMGFTSVEGWNVDYDDGPLRFLGNVRDAGTARNSGLALEADGRLSAYIHGSIQSYVPVARHVIIDEFVPQVTTVYKLESYDAIVDAVSTGELYSRLVRGNRDAFSEVVSDDKIKDLRVKVTGIDDKTFGNDEFKVVTIYNISFAEGFNKKESLLTPTDCRLYLTLENSILDEIDNKQLNEWDFKRTPPENSREIDLKLRTVGRLAFTLINFREQEPASFNESETRVIKTEGGDYDLIDYTPAKYLLINRELGEGDQVIYLGVKENKVDLDPVTFDTTGFRFNLRSNLIYSRLAEYNIYETPTKESDFNFHRTKYKNQIIWSNPLLDANFFSGGRNFSVENFYNVPSEYGQILEVYSLSGNLYVFCQRGVALVLVGESLTQQKSGQVFVNNEDFITKHVWVLENLNRIRSESIIKTERAIYFTDTRDVYKVSSDSIENISLGVLDLEEGNYTATLVNKFNEYRLSNLDTNETFVYNYDHGVWYGPHTYVPHKTIEINNTIYSYKDGIIKEDIGNTFDGVPYDTVLQSVGNDTEVGAIDKTYRKFYFALDGENNTQFKYGKDYDELVINNIQNIIKKNGYYNQGIINTEGNTKKIYWELSSNNEDFALKGFRTGYTFRRRR